MSIALQLYRRFKQIPSNNEGYKDESILNEFCFDCEKLAVKRISIGGSFDITIRYNFVDNSSLTVCDQLQIMNPAYVAVYLTVCTLGNKTVIQKSLKP